MHGSTEAALLDQRLTTPVVGADAEDYGGTVFGSPARPSIRPPVEPEERMSQISDFLMSILDLERLERNLFRGHSPQIGWQRVFGGQVIGQALVAACRTVEGPPAAFAARLFHAAGRPRRCRSSTRSSASATAAASPRGGSWPSSTGEAIFSMSASFQVRGAGLRAPCRCRTCRARGAARARPRCTRERAADDAGAGARLLRARAADRAAARRDRALHVAASRGEPKFNVWIRATGRLPDDPAIHQCVLAYASDMTLLDSTLIAHGRTVFDREIQAASLDHALWFHRPFRADEWLLYAQDSPVDRRRPRILPRLDFRPRRHARRVRRAGRPDPAARGPRMSALQAECAYNSSSLPIYRRRSARTYWYRPGLFHWRHIRGCMHPASSQLARALITP